MESFRSFMPDTRTSRVGEVLSGAIYRPIKSAVAAQSSSDTEGLDAKLFSPEDPPWLVLFTTNIERLSKLSDGWDGPGSIAINRQLLYNVTKFIRQSLGDLQRMTSPHAVPGGDGTIQIEWHEGAGEIELDFSPDGSATIWGREHRTGHEFEGEGAEALDLFNRWAPRIAQTKAYAVHVRAQSQSSSFSIAA